MGDGVIAYYCSDDMTRYDHSLASFNNYILEWVESARVVGLSFIDPIHISKRQIVTLQKKKYQLELLPKATSKEIAHVARDCTQNPIWHQPAPSH